MADIDPGTPGADGQLTVLLGGARSGKSALAVRWGRTHGGPVVIVATAEPGDDEMRERIAHHRGERPGWWTTVEEPHDIGAAVAGAADDALVIVDCLTLWVANVFDQAGDAAVVADAERLGAVTAARRSPTIVISNEVGLGIVPADPSTRRYRDLLGRVNAAVTAHAARAWLLIAGRVAPLHVAPSRPTGVV